MARRQPSIDIRFLAPKFIKAAEDGLDRAQTRVKTIEDILANGRRARELRRVEEDIYDLEPLGNYQLSEDGERELARLKEYRRQLKKDWQEKIEPLEEEANLVRPKLLKIEESLRKLKRQSEITEPEPLKRLLHLVEPLTPYLIYGEHQAIREFERFLIDSEKRAEEEAEADEREEPEAAAPTVSPPPPSDVEFEPGDDEIIRRLISGEFDSADEYQLNFEAQHLSLAGGFDELICLPFLHGVEYYPHQINTARQALRSMRGRALLCDEVGLGKTIEAGLILKEYLMRGLARRVLVLTPPALVSQWREEMEDKFGISFLAHDDPNFRALGESAWERTDRVIASIHTAKLASNREAISKIPYDLIIADEAHHLKNRDTLSWKFVNGLKSKYLLLLTATPVQNDLDELFNLITLLAPGQLKTAAAFRREFVAKGDARAPKNRVKLRQLLMDVMVRNTRSQVSVILPPRRATTWRVKLTPDERKLYDAVTDFVRKEFRGKSIERFLAQTLQMEVGSSARALRSTLETMSARLSAREKKVKSGIEELLDLSGSVAVSAKILSLIDLLRQRPDKLLVFTRYRETLRFLLDALERAGFPAAHFSGDLTAAQKDEQVTAFSRDRQVMISTDVGSEGRNLQFCHAMVNYDLPWNPMQIEQRVGRIHRIGQTEPVQIYNFASRDTVEDYVLEILDSKINMFELVVGEVGEILGNLDEEREFDDLVMDLWTEAESTEAARDAFAGLGDRLTEARRKYQETRAYDEALFGEDFVADE